MSNDSEDAWESDAYVGSFPPVFHPWAGIYPRPLPSLNITGSIIENVGKNGKHLVVPVRLPICMNMTWKNVPQPVYSLWGMLWVEGSREVSGASKVHTR